MERLYLLGSMAAVCGTGSMDLLLEEPLWPAIVAATAAVLLMRLTLRRIAWFQDDRTGPAMAPSETPSR